MLVRTTQTSPRLGRNKLVSIRVEENGKKMGRKFVFPFPPCRHTKNNIIINK
jgi:hypothetical protein